MSSGVSQLLRCGREAIRDWGSGWMNEGADQNAIRRGCSSSRALEWLRSLRNKRRCSKRRDRGWVRRRRRLAPRGVSIRILDLGGREVHSAFRGEGRIVHRGSSARPCAVVWWPSMLGVRGRLMTEHFDQRAIRRAAFILRIADHYSRDELDAALAAAPTGNPTQS